MTGIGNEWLYCVLRPEICEIPGRWACSRRWRGMRKEVSIFFFLLSFEKEPPPPMLWSMYSSTKYDLFCSQETGDARDGCVKKKRNKACVLCFRIIFKPATRKGWKKSAKKGERASSNKAQVAHREKCSHDFIDHVARHHWFGIK